MALASEHIISVHNSDQSAPWDDLEQAVEVVRFGLRDERYIVLTLDQGVSLAVLVRASAIVCMCCCRDCCVC